MEFLVDKISSTYTWISGYYYGQEKVEDLSKLTTEEKIVQLRKILNSECIYSEEVQGKIEMQFTRFANCLQYQKVCFSTEMPAQYPIPKEKANKKLICFQGSCNINLQIAKCLLVIQIVFLQNFPLSLPKIYVKTPETQSDSQRVNQHRTAKPYHKYVFITQKNQENTKYKYRARTDGIQIILQPKAQDWKFDLISLLDQCVSLMRKQFPFVKIKQPVPLVDIEANIDFQTKRLYQLAQNLRSALVLANTKPRTKPKIQQQSLQSINQLPQFLVMVQQLDIISRIRESETQNLQKQNIKLLELLDQMQKDSQILSQYSQFYPELLVNDPLQEELFHLIIGHEATKDCLDKVEAFVKQPQESEDSTFDEFKFKKVMLFWQKINQAIFFQRCRIKEIVNLLKAKCQSNLN